MSIDDIIILSVAIILMAISAVEGFKAGSKENHKEVAK